MSKTHKEKKHVSTLSIIVNTAPEREANLKGCLSQLSRQTFQDFEVLVCDDGSEQGEPVAASFHNKLNLRYFWRPNDLCVNRSRNQGIAASKSQHLVLLDGDCLLNPRALEVYAHLLNKYPHALWSGYFGYIRQHTAPSNLLKGRYINYLDRRFHVYCNSFIRPASKLLEQPAQNFWGANIAFSKAIWERLKGFDESFRGWGNNDTDFAFRALEKGFEIHFCLDSWGEHQIHDYQENYHQRFWVANSSGQTFFEQRQHPDFDYPIMIYASPKETQALSERIFRHYIQQDPALSPSFKAHFLHPEVRLLLRNSPKDQWQMAWALPKST